MLIGVIHLKPLPGSPRFGGDMRAVIKAAIHDLQAYEQGGADAVFVENFGDVPFAKSSVPAATVAAMAVCGQAVREFTRLPIGFNVLRNDPGSGLGLCAACGGNFIRVNVHCGAMLTDQGMIEGDAFNTLRARRALGLDVQIYADVHVKHATVIGEQSIEDAAKDTLERGLADALVISGRGTGAATKVADLERVRAACPEAKIFLGSGVTEKNVADYAAADGLIVGSSLKQDGRLDAPVDPQRVERLVRAIRG